jgi:hypothetical protein
MSNYLEGRAVTKVAEGLIVERATALPPQTDTESLFAVVGGRVILKAIIGEVTTAIGNVANDTRLSFDPDDAAAGNMCANLDIDDDAAGTIYAITGTVANAMVASTDVVLRQATEHILKAGTIDLICAGSSVTGAIKWTVLYVPIDDGAYVEVA